MLKVSHGSHSLHSRNEHNPFRHSNLNNNTCLSPLKRDIVEIKGSEVKPKGKSGISFKGAGVTEAVLVLYAFPMYFLRKFAPKAAKKYQSFMGKLYIKDANLLVGRTPNFKFGRHIVKIEKWMNNPVSKCWKDTKVFFGGVGKSLKRGFGVSFKWASQPVSICFRETKSFMKKIFWKRVDITKQNSKDAADFWRSVFDRLKKRFA